MVTDQRNEALKRRFERDLDSLVRTRVNVILAVGGTLVPLFGMLDAVLFPGLFEKFMLYRLAGAVVCWILYLINRKTDTGPSSFALGTIAFYVVGAAIIAMIVETGGSTTPYYAGLNLVFLTYCVVLPVHVRKLALHCGLLYLSYVISVLVLSPAPVDHLFFAHNLFISATLTIILIAAHIEYGQRWREYLLRTELAETRAKLEEYSKRLESSVVETEAKYRQLVENANDAIFICQDGLIRFPNPQTELIFGRSAEVLENTLLFDMIHEEDREVLLETFEKLELDPQQPYPTPPLRIPHPSGRVLWLDMNVVPVEWQQRPAFLCIARDITAKRQMEQELIQLQKLEAIGTLAGGIAHDFNNILQAIQGYLEILTLKKKRDDPDMDILSRCLQTVERGSHLTRQLLIYGRKAEEHPAPVDINAAVVRVCEMLERVLPKTIKIDLRLDGQLRRIQADPHQIEQVVMNLVMNAGDAMPSGGTIGVLTENVAVDTDLARKAGLAPTSQGVKITVWDTGPGIPPEIQDRIYEPFFTTKAPGKGTGLGLAIVYSVVKRFGGGIVCDSQPGKGTRFHIYFPAFQGESVEREPSPKAETDSDFTGRRILIVDDEPHLLEISRHLLETQGIEVFTAETGEEAIELLEKIEGRVDCIFLDLNMPGMGGPRCMEEILRRWPDLPVVIATGYLDTERRTQLLKRGAASFMEKPYKFEAMLATIRDVIR